jgi:hypothetical protein
MDFLRPLDLLLMAAGRTVVSSCQGGQHQMEPLTANETTLTLNNWTLLLMGFGGFIVMTIAVSVVIGLGMALSSMVGR